MHLGEGDGVVEEEGEGRGTLITRKGTVRRVSNARMECHIQCTTKCITQGQIILLITFHMFLLLCTLIMHKFHIITKCYLFEEKFLFEELVEELSSSFVPSSSSRLPLIWI
mmetsp:Transcript_16856/g.23595  ORF Transcript_16856/g.23595 Transcript_16856/m.23595 type:complete len:111 (+) Transcript_16856:1332-1664(+)